MTVRTATLANGLRVITEAMPHMKTSTVGVWVDAGAREETPDNNGVAHMLEHMAFKGTERRSARAIAEEIEAVGGALNAYTSREQTAYYARVMAEHVPLAVDIIGDILQHSVFDDGELTRERTVIAQEIAQVHDTPDDIIFDHLQQAAYPGQSLGRSILGTAERVAAMTRDQLQGFMRANYGARGMVLSAAGAVDHDEIVDLAARHFGAHNGATRAPGAAARYAAGEFRDESDFDQAHLALAFPGVAYGDPDFYAMQVYATLLGGGMSSRLFQEVRENRGLAYTVTSFATSYRDGGLFTIYSGADGENLDELVAVIAGEVRKTAAEVGDGEIARARQQMRAGLLMSLESSSARAEQLARQVLIYGRHLSTEEIIAGVDAVGQAEVGRAVKRLLSGGNLSLAVVGPIKRLENYQRIAARFA
jgi:predicted Zn-dependent peptidase